MKLCTTWIVRTYSQDAPELVCAWAEYDVDANYEGYQEDRQKALDAIGKDLHTFRDIDIDISYDDVCTIFKDAEIEGKVDTR